jgi:hypothetical protein
LEFELHVRVFNLGEKQLLRPVEVRLWHIDPRQIIRRGVSEQPLPAMAQDALDTFRVQSLGTKVRVFHCLVST